MKIGTFEAVEQRLGWQSRESFQTWGYMIRAAFDPGGWESRHYEIDECLAPHQWSLQITRICRKHCSDGGRHRNCDRFLR